MANILKLQDQLKGLPDTALVQYAQNPDGNVPQYLILGELQRRKTMRDEYQQSQAQAPQSTVAEDLAGGVAQLQPAMQQPQPQQPVDQGVASLPVPDNMFQEQSMAGGGIVAFDDGGEVNRYAGRGPSLVSSSPNYGTSLDLMKEKRAQLMRKLESLERSGQAGVDEDRAILLNALETPGRVVYNTAADIYEGVGGLGARIGNIFTGKPTYETAKKPRYEKLVAESATLRDEIANLDAAIAQTEKQGAMPIAGQAIESPVTKTAAPSGTMPVPTVGRAPSLPEPIEFNPTLFETEPARQRMLEAGDKYAEEAVRAKQKELREAAGIKDIYADQLSELQKEREGLKGRKDEAIGQAFLEAGLGMMAGTSPFALTNIGTGAMRGVASLKEAQKEIRQNERELRRETNSINREQQGVLEARLRGDQEAVERGQARIDAATARYEDKADKNAMLENQALQFNIGKKFDRDLAQFSSSSADFRLDKQLAADAAKHNNMMRMYEERIKASDRATAAKLLQNRVYALREMNKDPDYQMFLESLTSKYEKKGGASNPQYQFEKQMYTNRYLSDALGLSGGLDSGVSSADSLLAD